MQLETPRLVVTYPSIGSKRKHMEVYPIEPASASRRSSPA